MKRVTLVILATVFIALAGGSSFGQQKSTPEKEALIKELLAVSGSAKGTKDMANMMASFQQSEAEKLIKELTDNDKTMSPEEKEAVRKSSVESIARLTKRIDEFFDKELDLDKEIDEVAIPIYDKHYSETEIRELIAFHRSPVGQKTLAVMPQMMMDLMSGFVEKIGPKLRDFLKRATNEEYALIKKEFEARQAQPKPKSKL
jgi:uncharacterized protein